MFSIIFAFYCAIGFSAWILTVFDPSATNKIPTMEDVYTTLPFWATILCGPFAGMLCLVFFLAAKLSKLNKKPN